MLFNKTSKNSVTYRVIVSKEDILGGCTLYGIEGVEGNKRLVLKALTDNEIRIERLVENLNKSQLELCKLEGVIYGIFCESSWALAPT